MRKDGKGPVASLFLFLHNEKLEGRRCLGSGSSKRESCRSFGMSQPRLEEPVDAARQCEIVSNEVNLIAPLIDRVVSSTEFLGG